MLIDDRPDGVRVLTLNRPAKRNALNFELLEALTQALLDPGGNTRAIILRGAGGRAFSAGFDLDELTGTASDLEVDAAIGRAAVALSECPAPIVAQLEGHCHGGAVEIALNCDLRVATTDLEMSLRAVSLGVVYRTELLARLVSTIGLGRTQQLLLGMPVLQAAEALAWGLVGEVLPVGEVAARVEAIAAALAAGPASAVRGTKATLALLARRAAGPDVVAAAESWRRAAAESDERRRALDAAKAKLGRSGRK